MVARLRNVLFGLLVAGSCEAHGLRISTAHDAGGTGGATMLATGGCTGPSTIASGRRLLCPRDSRGDRLAENASGHRFGGPSDLKYAIRRSFGEVRQTSLCAKTVSLGRQAVAPSDLDPRQVPRASERRGHEVQSCSNLGWV